MDQFGLITVEFSHKLQLSNNSMTVLNASNFSAQLNNNSL